MSAEKETRHDERMETIMNHTTMVANETAQTLKKTMVEQPIDLLLIQPGTLDEQIVAQ